MSAIATAFVAVRADMSKMKGDVSSGMAGSGAETEATGIGHKIGGKLAVGVGIAFAAAGAGLAKFAGDSIEAFRGASEQQAKLSDAFSKFPALADISKNALTDYNTVLGKSTGIDDDLTAAGQASLAQFGLTGQQLKQLTPLLQDYSVKVGKDMPTAATDLGRALLGQGRALKDVGINFVDTKSQAGNFSELVGSLTDKVGGFATKGLDPAALNSKRLSNQWSELQEKVGSKLVPVLDKLTEVGLRVVDWISQNTDSFVPLAAGLGIATVAVMALNIAMSLNPAALVVIGLAALGAALVVLWNKSETFRLIVTMTWSSIKEGAQEMWAALSAVFFSFIEGAQQIWHGMVAAKDGIVIAWFAVRDAALAVWNWMRDMLGRLVAATVTAKDGIVTAWTTVVQWFRDLPGRIGGAVGDLGRLLYAKGQQVITGLWDGLKDVWDKVTGWVSGIAGWIKDHKGPVSLDATLLKPAGQALMNGFLDGLKSAYANVATFIGAAGGNVSSGVQQWAGLVGEALAQLGQPQSALPAVLARMQRESGGNPTIQNNWDSNYFAGTPSIGLMQTISPTFRAYADQYVSRGITDPFANIYAGINYAIHRYGSGWIARMGAPGGYDSGGWLPQGASIAVNQTGVPERVLSPHDQIRLHPDDIVAIGAAAARAVFAGNTASRYAMTAGR